MAHKKASDRKAYQRNYYSENRESKLEKVRAYQSDHKDERRAYLAENRKRTSARHKEWASKNKEHLKLYRSAWHIKNRLRLTAKRYGLTPDQYLAMVGADKLCQICGSRPANGVDHCHKSRKVRGALCRQCNTGLGQFGDNPQWLVNAIEYLASHQGTQTR